jgi:hypothetical protein
MVLPSGDNITAAVAAPESLVPLSPCAASDNGDPHLLSASITPARVDVRHHPAKVTVRLGISDDGGPGPSSGIASIRLGVNFVPVDVLQASDGSWRGSLTVPVGSAPGRRVISDLVLRDNAGNQISYQEADLTRLGLGASFTIVSAADRSRPVLRDLHLSRTSVDTRHRVRRVHISARATDNTGVTGVMVAPVTPRGYPGVELHRASGTARNGRWVGVLKVSKWLSTSRWDLQVAVEDARNTTSYDAKRLSRLHFSSSLFVRSHADLTEPRVITARPSTRLVDVSTQDGSIVLTVQAKDIGSGIQSVTSTVRGADGDDLAMTRVAGTRHRGTWRLAVPLTHCGSRDRNWAVRFVLLDRSRLSTATQGIVTFHVHNGDIVKPQASPGSDNRIPPYVVSFNEDVAGVSDASAVVRVLPEKCCLLPPPSPPVAGTWSCFTAADTPVDCVNGPLRTATWTPAEPLTPDATYWVEVNPEHVLDVTDLFGNPAETPGGIVFGPSRA